jgi:hypothetical protein
MVLSKGSACLAGGALESTANMREGKEPPGLDVARCRGLAISGTGSALEIAGRQPGRPDP